MPATLTMHTTNSQESLSPTTAISSLRPVKHVRFVSEILNDRRHSIESVDSFAESYKGWTPDTTATSAGVRNNSQDRHSSTRHTIPIGSSRRESVEGFDDIKRRWSMESLSEEASAIDDE
ncbi:hypothetical protein D6D04_04106 [Aureobasidium pullulans]|nr:hypothetical protein D6D04_04106 [Aureobasidium pullulans]